MEREAKLAARKAARAERDRLNRNYAARERRARRAELRPKGGELSKLIGALNLLASPFEGERAAAAFKVEILRAKSGRQWDELLKP
jgi:hypothetical protein